MAKYRIGKDLPIKWTLMNGGSPYDLTGRDFKVWLICYGWKMEITDRSVVGNVISFTFWGKDQEELGDYYLLYDENNGRPAMLTHDAKAMFTLVPHSWLEGGDDPDEIEIEAIEVTSNVNVAGDENVIETIEVNGVEQPVVDKTVNISAVQPVNDGAPTKVWVGTQEQYDALTPSGDTIYLIKED